MFLTQESVKSAFCMQIPGACKPQGKCSHIFVINSHFDSHFVCIFFFNFFFIFLLEAKCLQLDSNFIANNLREKNGWRHFSISHDVFTYNWPPSWAPSRIYRNAQ